MSGAGAGLGLLVRGAAGPGRTGPALQGQELGLPLQPPLLPVLLH